MSGKVDSSQGVACIPHAPSWSAYQQRYGSGNMVFKSGSLSLYTKGLWPWKKRWFILTRTSLVFFKSDPNLILQKGSEVNLTLDGIDLNNSGSVVVKEDGRLLTVLVSDGHDGRTFRLKAETLEDFHEWKAALENALAQAPNAAFVVGQNAILKHDQVDVADGSLEKVKDKLPLNDLVVGRQILLALEDVDGTPSFLEKALRFIEVHGIEVEGILRQAADVDDVERRVQEYEQGNTEFSSSEDPHVVADCVKLVLRELPSSPVPATCCNALLVAFRTAHGERVPAMRAVIMETFPEPNRRLLQRILMMMQTVALHKDDNRMSSSAVAACMAPLLLQPLLAGDCKLEHDFDVGGDGSIQLMQAAAAANHANAIVITLLKEYDKIFGEGSVSKDLYSDSEESGRETAELSDDDDEKSFENDDSTDDPDEDTDDVELASRRTYSEGCDSEDEDSYDNKSWEASSSNSEALEKSDYFRFAQKSSPTSPQTSFLDDDNIQRRMILPNQSYNNSTFQADSEVLLGDIYAQTKSVSKLDDQHPSSFIEKSVSISNARDYIRRPGFLRRRNHSMESFYSPTEEQTEIQRLVCAKLDLQNMITVEVKKNTHLQEGLEKRKRELQERRLALEQDVAELQKQLQREKYLTSSLEAGLKMPHGPLPASAAFDEKTKADLEEVAVAEVDICNLEKKFDSLELQLNQQRGQCHSVLGPYNDHQRTPKYHKKMRNNQRDVETSGTSHHLEGSSRNKGVHKNGSVDGIDILNERKCGASSTTLPNKQTLQAHPLYTLNSESPCGLTEPPKLTPPSNTKKTGSVHEQGGNSRISKVKTRFNFLKELQNFDKDRGGRNSFVANTDEQNEELQCVLPYSGNPGKGRRFNGGQKPKRRSKGSVNGNNSGWDASSNDSR